MDADHAPPARRRDALPAIRLLTAHLCRGWQILLRGGCLQHGPCPGGHRGQRVAALAADEFPADASRPELRHLDTWQARIPGAGKPPSTVVTLGTKRSSVI